MNDIGNYALLLSWFTALAGCLGGAVAGLKKSPRWLLMARNSTILSALFGVTALVMLGAAFYHNDYSNKYVWQFSNRDMPAVYKVSAIWGGMDGSMLLWAAILTVCGALVALRVDKYPRLLMPWTLAVINSSSLFFLSVTLFFTNPFRYIAAPFVPFDGNGLNPLLQNPFMAIHPPTLYTGFTMLSVPYAFCLGAMLSGYLTNDWIRLTRRWTLVAWAFLTAGITLGGYWAYIELGWGGFWAWDPVENASFLPWLTATAFLHSVMVQERKEMLKFWNVWLVVATYGLTVFGTFLTRSGIVQSVHAFAATDIGPVFLIYLAALLIVTGVLSYYRRQELKSPRRIESLFSREAAFLLNNLLLLSICFATLWGVMFPVLSEAVTGEKQTVSIPFFNSVNVPLFLALIFLMGIGPLIAWRRASLKSLRKTFLMPFLAAFAMAIVLVWAGIVEFYPVLSYSLAFFVLLTILGELHRGIKVQRGAADSRKSVLSASVTALRRHRIRYGGYFVHFGVLVMAVAITASMAHKVEREFVLSDGGEYQIGRFTLRLEGTNELNNRNYQGIQSQVSVIRRADGKKLGTLKPELRRYFKNDESTTEVALMSSLREDLYLVLAGTDSGGRRMAFKVFINPLQCWLWIGALLVVIGTVIVLIPRGALAHVAVGVADESFAAAKGK
ncbi:MAG: heme lyase CcmF/NrfE family subunit [Candidatus Dadabacteria bacterium]|nr:MAG: heme lyase CcmF/NrfE family subunit [Candidatus Dadabacteria bacterium]